MPRTIGGVIVVIARREPVHDRANDGQHHVGLPRAVIVLDASSKAATSLRRMLRNGRSPQNGQDVHLQQPA